MTQLSKSTTFRVCLSFCAVILGVLYVFQTTTLSTKGYDIDVFETRVTQLKRENEKVEVEIAQLRSMQSIKDRLTNLNMVIASDARYVQDSGNAVARR